MKENTYATLAYGLLNGSTADMEKAKVLASLANADELRMQNLIACSQKVYIRDSPDAIRKHFGEEALGMAFTVFPEEEALAGWIGEYLEDSTGSVYSSLGEGEEPGDIGFDGYIDVRRMARTLLLQMKAALQ